MDLKEEVQNYIQTHSPKNVGELFSHFKTNIDAIILACRLLEWTDDWVKDMLPKTFSENDLIERIDKYAGSDELFYLLVPQTVQTALVLFFNYADQKDKSLNIIKDKLSDPDYIKNLDNQKLFDNSVVFFSSPINLKEEYLNQIQEKISSLDVMFQEDAYREIFTHFQLAGFMVADEESVGSFVEIVEKYKSENFYPIMVSHVARFKEDYISYNFESQYLKNSILGYKSELNYNKILKSFMKEVKSEILDESAENSAKLALTSTLGIGALDVGIKAVKIFLSSISESEDEMSPHLINRNYLEFKESGSSDVKSWFIIKMKNQLQKALEDSKLENHNIIDLALFNNAYQEFIKKYYMLGSTQEDPTIVVGLDHTQVFLMVYEAVNNMKIIVNNDY